MCWATSVLSIAEMFGLLDQREVAFPRGVVRFLRVLQSATAAVNERPDSETHFAITPWLGDIQHFSLGITRRRGKLPFASSALAEAGGNG